MKLVVLGCLGLTSTCWSHWTDLEVLVQRIAISKTGGQSNTGRFFEVGAEHLRGYLNTYVDNATISIMRVHTKPFDREVNAATFLGFPHPNVSWWRQVERRIDVFRERSREMALIEAGPRNECRNNCKATIAMDFFMFALSMFGVNCGPATLMIYYSLGMATLIEEQNLSVPDALMVLGEMSTQVGYGSNVPYDCMKRGCEGLKLFHALHSWVGVVMVNGQWNEGVNLWLYHVYKAAEQKWHIPKRFVAVIFLLLQLAASTAVYAADFWDGEGRKNTYSSYLLNALYMNLMSFSTVGYGDVSPQSDWGKVISPINLQLGTRFFSALGEVVGASTPSDETKLWKIEKTGDVFDKWYRTCLPEPVKSAGDSAVKSAGDSGKTGAVKPTLSRWFEAEIGKRRTEETKQRVEAAIRAGMSTAEATAEARQNINAAVLERYRLENQLLRDMHTFTIEVDRRRREDANEQAVLQTDVWEYEKKEEFQRRVSENGLLRGTAARRLEKELNQL